MPRSLRTFFATLLLALAIPVQAWEPPKHVEGTPDLGPWGLEVGFGSQPYMEGPYRFAILTPYLYKNSMDGYGRLVLETSGRVLQGTNSLMAHTAVGLHSETKLYKDITSFYTRLMLGFATSTGRYYRGSLTILPLNLGLQVVTANTSRGVSTFFVDYQFVAWSNFENAKSTVKKSVLFSGSTTVGLRYFF